ncbi:type II secretion system minor pseudopilin GspH [Glaciecola sp. XM2]|uniref:type II secretion system minor pseudopilin GspH n=1 Tax=Glaciecola sp. XM2 TaxID=1914931 RepID=UPI001BDE2FCA|nr:type II secretion system minor pseudopilin GspH [Glaciecola sp. XM2]MBT1451395.1 type II secretion system minor pseudopilin GspH [Glaciecola sp. XM2]
MQIQSAHHTQRGFTLLEIILVVALMGLVVSVVSFNVFDSDPEQGVEEETRRLQVLFDMASDYAVLNQKQLGLRIDDKNVTYEFVELDEQQEWQPIESQAIFELKELPEFYELELSLDNLPWQTDDSLFDTEVFDEQLSVSDEGVEIGNEEDVKPPPPQILILSSGENTPFELKIIYDEPFSQKPAFYFSLLGEEVPPLKREGPEVL